MELSLLNIITEKTKGNFQESVELIKSKFLKTKDLNLILHEAIYYDEIIDEEVNGFLIKINDNKIFYSVLPDKTFEVKVENENILDEDIWFSLAIVHDVHTDLTETKIKEKLSSNLTDEDLDIWAKAFMNAVTSNAFSCSFVDVIHTEIEDMLENSKAVFSFDNIQIVEQSNDITVENILENDSLNEKEEKTVIDEEIVQEKIEEKNEDLNEEANEIKQDELVEDMKQLSLFPEETNEIKSEVKTKPRKKRKTRKNNKGEIPKMTIEEVKNRRPHVFDDSWIDSYLDKFDLGDEKNRYLNLILKYRKYRRDKYMKMNRPDAFMFVSNETNIYRGYPHILKKALAAAFTGVNLLLTGETSTGKTTLIETISKLLNIPMFTVNGSRDLNIETLLGFKDLEDGDIVVKNGGLIQAMLLGGMVYIDEANLILPSVLGIAHGALDHRRTIYNELTGEIVEADKDFLVSASINERYEDTVEMNKATRNRFVAIEMTYMSREDLVTLLESYEGFNELQELLFDTEVSTADIWTLADIFTALQEAVKSEQISPDVASIRNIIDLLKLTRILSWEDAIMMIIENYDLEDRANILAALQDVERINIKAENIVQGALSN